MEKLGLPEALQRLANATGQWVLVARLDGTAEEILTDAPYLDADDAYRTAVVFIGSQSEIEALLKQTEYSSAHVYAYTVSANGVEDENT